MKSKINKDKISSTQITYKTLKYFFPAAWNYKKSFFFLYSLHTLFSALQPFINLYFLPIIINELTKGSGADFKLIMTYAVEMILTNALVYFISTFLDLTLQKYAHLFEVFVSKTCSEKCMTMDFYLTEDKNALDQREKAVQGMSWYSGGIYGMTSSFFQIINNIIKFVGVVSLIALNAPWLILIIVIVVILQAFVQKKLNEIQFKGFRNMSKSNRIFGYYLFNITNFQNAKDFRLYNAKDMILSKCDSSINELIKFWKKQADDSNPHSHFQSLVAVLSDFPKFFYIGMLALTKAISIGTFQQMFSSCGVLNQALNGIVSGVQWINQRCSYAYEFVKFMEYPSTMKKGDKVPLKQKHTVEFKHVSFKYPGSEVEVLKDVSIKINSGEHLSIVGLNGAGKTTFIKLLCRLYDVTSGEILVDGINIKDYSFDEYIKLFSVVFQDFKIFSFSIKENITIGKDNSNIEGLYKEVGLDKKIKSLNKGDSTNIFRSFDEKGIELSGGEQQKLAIARALYKNSPIVILDEPTAALDPIAEYEIYKQFNTMIGGKTAFYISHRLSSCQFCDKIALFSEGTIKEYGTHSELVKKKGGLYAKMFEAQAQYYR
ncbi:MAG: ABC transporter ATP-binding protein [Treponema sp.]